MRTRKDIKNIALNKLQEARALYEVGYYDGAFYLGGYCVEMAL